MWSFIKSTFLSGILFLIPFGAIVVVLSQFVPIIIVIDNGLIGLFPEDSFLGAVAKHLVALLIVLTLCLLVGVFAKSRAGKRVSRMLSDAIFGNIPGFHFFRGFTQSLRESDEIASEFKPVVVDFDDMSQLAFKIEEAETGEKVVVYLPGAPNPWSGSICYVDPDRVRPLDVSVPDAVMNIRRLGQGSWEIRKAQDAS